MSRKTEVLVKNRQQKVPLKLQAIEQSLHRLLEHLDQEGHQVSLTLVDDEEIRSINRQYLDRDRPTNVIAFSMREGDFGEIHPHLLGDIIVSAETAQKDALEGDLPAEDMILYLIIHGLLHLLGYDHEGSSEEEARMVEKEQELFFALKHYVLERG